MRRDRAWRRKQTVRIQRNRIELWTQLSFTLGRQLYLNNMPRYRGRLKKSNGSCSCSLCKPWKAGWCAELKFSDRRRASEISGYFQGMKINATKFPRLSKILSEMEPEDSEMDAAYETESRKQSDPSLRPPKKWWKKKHKEVKEGNPSYSEETIRETVGKIWYHNMTDAQRKEAREHEGKHYGEAK